jgi:pimeloyl-ACP methyl ester carboxylesterase
MLLPGSVFNSLMWTPNVEALCEHFRVYAVDNVYDSGRSIYTRAPRDADDFLLWLDELFTALEPGDRIRLMGLSYGSWLASLYAIRFPGRLSSVVLLSHPAIVSVNPGFVMRLLFCLVWPRYITNFCRWLLQDTASRDDEEGRRLMQDSLEEMRLAGRCFKPKATIVPKTLKDDELQSLRVPALFLFGEQEMTFAPGQALQRLKTVAPQLRAGMVPGAGHALNFEQSGVVNRKVVEFLKEQ